jgi:hypothetical protein
MIESPERSCPINSSSRCSSRCSSIKAFRGSWVAARNGCYSGEHCMSFNAKAVPWLLPLPIRVLLLLLLPSSNVQVSISPTSCIGTRAAIQKWLWQREKKDRIEVYDSLCDHVICRLVERKVHCGTGWWSCIQVVVTHEC